METTSCRIGADTDIDCIRPPLVPKQYSLFDWAPFHSTKAAIKLHTLLDLRGAIPAFIHTGVAPHEQRDIEDAFVANNGNQSR